MKASELIALFERMYSERWTYAWGAAREGCVDCSGAFVWAFAQFGRTIAHGSNSIARRYIAGTLRPISEARPGWALFKRRDDNAGMPAQYRGDGIGDIYHVGLCSRDGTRALNAKGEAYGFCSDPLSKWAYAAPLKGVDYTDTGKGDKPMSALYQATVNTDKDPLRVRDAPGTGSAKIGSVPRGAVVDILADDTPGWPLIQYGSLRGYASSKYLLRGVVPDQPATNPGVTHPPDDSDTVTITLADAQAIYEALSEAYRMLSAALGAD